MNPSLDQLQPYPFERLRALYAGVTPNPALRPIALSIGEPKHPTPDVVKASVEKHVAALSGYPPTAGSEALRAAIAGWLTRRYPGIQLDSASQVLPVNGSREALFAFAQCVIDRSRAPIVVCPNPFYQIYEGAAILAGAGPYYVNTPRDTGFVPDYGSVPGEVWRQTQLLYTCSPSNPTGRVMTLGEWERLFDLSDRHGFAIASDECYSEIYFDERRPPLGALEAAARLGRDRFERLVVFSSLSKRSNCPGMRSGFVAGDAAILARFLLYRTYHGSAMSPTFQQASIAAWGDEEHVRGNRAKYVEKFAAAVPLLAPYGARMPEAGFYIWLPTPRPDPEFARVLFERMNVTVLPGSFLARHAHGVNPGERHVRLALVSEPAECIEAVQRIADYLRSN